MYWFPSSVQSDQDVKKFLFTACQQKGFGITTRKSDTRYTSWTGVCESCYRAIRINCVRGSTAQKSRGKGIRPVNTERPTSKEDLCPFYFWVYQNVSPDSPTQGRWFVARNGLGCAEHCSHPQLLPIEVKVPAKLVDKDEMLRVHKQLENNVSIAVIKQLL